MWYRKWKKYNLLGFVALTLILTGCQSSSQTGNHKNPKMISAAQTPVEKSIKQQYDSWKGTPYRYGGTTKAGVDCSALVVDFYNQFFDLDVPRITASQAQIGEKVKDLKPGDLVFFKTGRGNTGLHVGIYYKNGEFLHAGTTKGVMLSNMNEKYWKKRFWQSRRILDE